MVTGTKGGGWQLETLCSGAVIFLLNVPSVVQNKSAVIEYKTQRSLSFTRLSLAIRTSPAILLIKTTHMVCLNQCELEYFPCKYTSVTEL